MSSEPRLVSHVEREGNDNLLCNGMLAITLQARMRRHVTAKFNITSAQPENKGDEIVPNRIEI